MKYSLFAFLLVFASCVSPINHNDPNFRAKFFPAVLKSKMYHTEWMRAHKNMLIWEAVPGANEHKPELKKFLDFDYKEMYAFYQSLGKDSIVNPDKITKLLAQMDVQAAIYKEFTSQLNSVEAYNDPAVLLPIQSTLLDNEGEAELGFRTLDELLTDIDRDVQQKAERAMK